MIVSEYGFALQKIVTASISSLHTWKGNDIGTFLQLRKPATVITASLLKRSRGILQIHSIDEIDR